METVEYNEFSWAIGVFEGEGSISSFNSDGYRIPILSLGMTDMDVINRFSQVFSGWRFYHRKGTNKPMHYYVTAKRDLIETFLVTIRPYLSVKKSLDCERALTLIQEARERRVRRYLTDDEISEMQKDRDAGMSIVDIVHKFSSSRSTVYRVTKVLTLDNGMVGT